MAYRLDVLSLASHGVVSPAPAGFCLASFPLASGGVIITFGGKLADPGRGHRIIEPWDERYYRFKYGRRPPRPSEAPTEAPAPVPERPPIMAELLAPTLDAQAEAVRALEDANAEAARGILELERDVLELQAYLAAAELAAQEAKLRDQAAIEAQLQENLQRAREALLLAMAAKRAHQNRLAALEAAVRFYF